MTSPPPETLHASQMAYDLAVLTAEGINLPARQKATGKTSITAAWLEDRPACSGRLEARVFRPAVAMFTSNDAVLPFPLRASLNRVDAQLDELS